MNWATKIDLATGVPVENPAVRYSRTRKQIEIWPGLSGAHNWLPMAFNPNTKLVYIPVSERPTLFSETSANIAPELPGSDTSYLEAWDPVAQKAVWRVNTVGAWGGGVMTTAGGLVFQGQADRSFNAYDAKNGKRLWTFDAHAPVLAPPITYTVKGVQYVTVVTGYGSSFGLFGRSNYAQRDLDLDYRTQQRRVLTFALNGKATLPPTPPRAPHAAPADMGFAPDSKRAAAGHALYGGNCIVCHGWNAVAAGTAPDLRWSAVSVSPDAFHSIVKDGALLSNGMPRFDELTPVQLEDIRFYLRSRAHEPAR